MTNAKDEKYTAPLWQRIRESDEPQIDMTNPRRLCFKWPLYAPAEVYVTNYSNHNGQATIEVWMHNYDTGDRIMAIAPTVIQLTSQRDKTNLFRALERWDDTLPWRWCVEYIAFRVGEIASRQHPVRMVQSNPDLSMEPDYLLWPMLYRGHPTVVFGSKASAKSLLALVISYVVQLPLTDNKVGLRPGSDQSCNVYYGDWEDSEATFQARWTAMQQGFKAQHTEIPTDLELPILCKTMTTRLADCVDELQADFAEHRIGLFIVDSLGPAAGGDLYSPQTALEFYEAVRSLNVTTLILAHHSKDPNTKTKSIFGSQFFTTLARSVWYAERDNEIDDPTEMTTSITEHQCNLAALHGSLGFRYQFDNEARTIHVAKCDLAKTGLRGRLPVSTQIKGVLGRHGSMTVNDLAEELEIGPKAIRKAMERLASKGAVLKTGKIDNMDAWSLTAEEQHRDRT